MKAKALDDAITNMLREVETETLIDYVAEVKAKAVVDALADTLADLETATLMADALGIMLKRWTPRGQWKHSST